MPSLDGDGHLLASLDEADYNPIDHLNAIFSHPSTLSSVRKTSIALRAYQDDLDREIRAREAQQAVSDADSVRRVHEAKAELASLFDKVEGVQRRAIETEQAITIMTADIKRLDNTKKNLTLSMTALKRLQMLTTAYEQLKALVSSRQYRECAQLLQAVIQLMRHFKTYRSIDQIATLSRNVADLQREMLEQVCEDFEVTFARGEIGQQRGMLAEACQVMDALGDNARSRLITWYCNTQLREYRHLFRGSEEAGSLENIGMRYSWFKRMLKTFDLEHAALFPPAWRVNELLANAFCEGTREDLRGILSKASKRTDGATMDVDLLLKCLQETLDFEHSLESKFSNTSRTSIDTVSSADDKANIFSHAISEAFEPHLNIWVEAQDRHLAVMIAKYKQMPLRQPDEDFNSQMVATSSTELFSFYRLTLSQCARLSPGAKLVDLTNVFAKYLDQYSQQVLWYHLSERPTGQTPSRVPNIEETIMILNTADYCYITSTQLEERIKSRIDPDFRTSIDLQSQGEAFMGIAAATVRALVRRVEADLEPAWREMRNVGWSRMEDVGDSSSYMSELINKLTVRTNDILPLMHKPQYARAFCDNLVDSTSTAYLGNIFQCKPISEVGAEQMLLDVYTLKNAFESLYRKMSTTASSTKRIATLISRIDPILKTLQVRPVPPEALIQAYLLHIADKSDVNFRKVLELKGLNRRGAEQTALLELFLAHRAAPRFEDLQATSPLFSGVGSHVSTTNENASPLSSIVSSRALSPDGTGSGAVGSTGTNLNENLRSIGKFFKRDGSGVGAMGRFVLRDKDRERDTSEDRGS